MNKKRKAKTTSKAASIKQIYKNIKIEKNGNLKHKVFIVKNIKKNEKISTVHLNKNRSKVDTYVTNFFDNLGNTSKYDLAAKQSNVESS